MGCPKLVSLDRAVVNPLFGVSVLIQDPPRLPCLGVFRKILPLFVRPWEPLRFLNRCACYEQQRAVRDLIALVR